MCAHVLIYYIWFHYICVLHAFAKFSIPIQATTTHKFTTATLMPNWYALFTIVILLPFVPQLRQSLPISFRSIVANLIYYVRLTGRMDLAKYYTVFGIPTMRPWCEKYVRANCSNTTYHCANYDGIKMPERQSPTGTNCHWAFALFIKPIIVCDVFLLFFLHVSISFRTYSLLLIIAPLMIQCALCIVTDWYRPSLNCTERFVQNLMRPHTSTDIEPSLTTSILTSSTKTGRAIESNEEIMKITPNRNAIVSRTILVI